MARRPISTSERAFVAIAAPSLPNGPARRRGRVIPPMTPPEAGRTLAQKLWDAHVVPGGSAAEGDPDLLYVDLHLVHEVTSPQLSGASGLPGPGFRGRTSRSRPW